MFERLLIANRGEIACRIAKTARRLAVRTVAVYSDADAHALHVKLADEAWRIGPEPAQDSYLAIEKIVDAARKSQAQAVHPGYGFLAEDPDFAEACERNGLIFVGPSVEAMRLMGSKASAKALMERAGVPTVPGYHGEAVDIAAFSDAAKRIGFPVLIKASAGGGGLGMRIVQCPEDLGPAMDAAEREALASFGVGRLLLEKYVARARHIEIQIFADKHGGVICFLERDCSLQRRQQKILEETPAPGLSNSIRQAMRDAAIAAVRAVSYVGAGTVEFLLEGDRFFFLEVNTRLQVEHPITEMIAGQDLVEWQLRIASGERLPLAQGELTTRGCAIEARICAEDPAQGFLPSVGQIKHLRFPKQDIAVRIDTGVSQGDRITQYYDSLIAKLIVWGESRHAALRRLRKKLSEFELVGVETNLDVLRAIASDHQFVSGEIDTNFVESNADRLLLRATISGSDESVILAAASVSWLQELRREQQGRSEETEPKLSPWSLGDAWRIDGRTAHHDLTFDFEGRKLTTRITPLADGFRMEALSASLMIDAAQIDGRVSLRAGDIKREVGVVRDGAALVIIIDGRNYPLVPVDSLQAARSETGSQVKMNAPIPARVTALFVSPGEKVKTGAPLVVLEAMKMEITLRAPRDAVVADVRCRVGEMASEGSELVVFAEDDRS